MEPHVFCGPEFILEVPNKSITDVLERVAAPPTSDTVGTHTGTTAASGWTVRPDFLLRVQTELYGLCTVEVRRQVHAQLALKECMVTGVRKAIAFVSRRMAHFQRIQLPTEYTGAGSSSGSVGSVPPAPGTVVMVEATSTNRLTAEELSSVQQSVRVATGSVNSNSTGGTASSLPPLADPTSPIVASAAAPVYVLLYVTDSRVAAQLYMLCLRNTFLALPLHCRLLNYYAFGGRAAGVMPAQILQKREQLRSHWNLDNELWSVLEAKLTDTLVEEVRVAGKDKDPSANSGRLLTAFEQHEQDVRAVLHYCEQKVRYAGVFDDDEEASPFLLAMGLCWRLRVTMDDVCRHFARHPRRVIRALALYLARYTLASEDYVYFFMPSVTDEVIIACTEDAQVTFAMKDLSKQLLTKNEVVDAWLPVVAKHWQETVVVPSIDFMEACWKAQEQHQLKGDQNEDEAKGYSSPASVLFREDDGTARNLNGPAGSTDPRGTGAGIAATFGFRSIAEIAEHAIQHARVLLPQSMATILKRRRGLEDDVFGGPQGNGEREDWDALEDRASDEDDDFLIHVEVQGDEEAEYGASATGGASNGSSLAFPSMKRARAGGASGGAASRLNTSGGAGAAASGVAGAATVRDKALTDPHRRIMREGLKLTLSLLGRRTLFRSNDEHYIEF